MTIDEMKEKKRELGLTNEMISSASGVPLSTVQKVFGGVTSSPRRLTLSAIEKALQSAGENKSFYDRHSTSSERQMLHEPSGNYNVIRKDKKYTLDDYYALPEERRVELIDGVIYDMAAPSAIHQRILGDLYVLFRECADKYGMPCEVFLSPFDVHLDKDNYTMVQPDLLAVCGETDEEIVTRFEGAPDLVVEILSPSSRSKDQVLKLYKYQNAGVKEYWIVDPDHETVMVYDFRDGNFYPEKYDFDSVIPIHISNGQCSIDFSRVNRALKKVRASK